jgi:integrase
MPTYQIRNGRVRAIVRVKGFEAASDTFPNKTRAKAWALKIEAEMREGTYVAPVKQSLRSVIERYIEEEECDRWERNRLLRLNREEKWVDFNLHECGDALAAWIEKRRKEVKPNTVRREATIISAVFTHAMKRWRIKLKINPMRDVALPPKGKARKRRVKPSEIDAIWDYFGRSTPRLVKQHVPFMFEFACETGIRLEELTELEWETTNEGERTVYVPPSKNGDERWALLTVRAIELLGLLPRDGDRVFPVNKGSIGTEFREACKALGIRDLHFHDSRHEACTRLSRFLSVIELARVIGHRDLNTLMVYYNPTPAELAAKLHDGARSTPARQPQPTSAFGWAD